ncbi:unnamed protein product [Fraxinus pennsylvanica]|uniref:Uncharacterized protein n=1 Tax=Fraxinus pennsylvanica TaxID=56036 RepID=A0AAD2EDI9_9LAMI|nr:unnamed protein product [Fraxinus pennsylvanica]
MVGRGKTLESGSAKKAQSRSSKAVLQFPMGRIARFLKAGKYAEHVGARHSDLGWYNEVERAIGIFERFVDCHPKVSAWIRYAKFEMKNREIPRARGSYERAVEKSGDDEEAEDLFVAFAEFEEKCKETERARINYVLYEELDAQDVDRTRNIYKSSGALTIMS